jgi:hypothetical protein
MFTSPNPEIDVFCNGPVIKKRILEQERMVSRLLKDKGNFQSKQAQRTKNK